MLGGVPGRAGWPRQCFGRRLGGRKLVFGGLSGWPGGPVAVIAVRVVTGRHQRFGGTFGRVQPGQVVGRDGPKTHESVRSACRYRLNAPRMRVKDAGENNETLHIIYRVHCGVRRSSLVLQSPSMDEYLVGIIL